MVRFYRFPGPARLLYREAIFRIPGGEHKIYITFDDGPTPVGTGEIIKVLKQNEVAKAVFFCNGSNILKYPEELDKITKDGYSLANHGYLHMDGWKSSRQDYISNCRKGAEITGSLFYRPPYGHITNNQYIDLKKTMRLVFWDLLLHDYNIELSNDYMMLKAEKLIRPGSVIVLHDKGNRSTPELLNRIIDMCRTKGYGFGDLTSDA